jgi:hypothetical protein
MSRGDGGTVDRLDALLARIDRLRVEEMLALAAVPADRTEYDRARAAAVEEARLSGRSARVREAEDEIERYVLSMFNRSTVQPGWLEANWGRPGTAADRAHLARSLADAVTAVILEDRLSEGHVAALLGPWAGLLSDDTDGDDALSR